LLRDSFALTTTQKGLTGKFVFQDDGFFGERQPRIWHDGVVASIATFPWGVPRWSFSGDGEVTVELNENVPMARMCSLSQPTCAPNPTDNLDGEPGDHGLMPPLLSVHVSTAVNCPYFG